MDSNFFKKLSDDLYELSNNYRKAAKETFPSAPGEAFRLWQLSEYAASLSIDLEEVAQRKELEHLEDSFNATL